MKKIKLAIAKFLAPILVEIIEVPLLKEPATIAIKI